jgi:hypothetical protein
VVGIWVAAVHALSKKAIAIRLAHIKLRGVFIIAQIHFSRALVQCLREAGETLTPPVKPWIPLCGCHHAVSGEFHFTDQFWIKDIGEPLDPSR